MAYATNPSRYPHVLLATRARELDLTFDDVVIVFAVSENFIPYFSAALQSLLENTSPSRRYDIVVLTRDISPSSMNALTGQVGSFPQANIGYLDVEAALGETQLPYYGHFRPETYFRLLAPSLLPMADKAIYLDSDLIILDDVAKLFDIDVEGYLLGATRDIDTIGQICGYEQSVGTYLKNELGLTDPMAYFQAGVLLMNLAEFRARTTPDALIALATQRTWRWLDQDVLNKVVDGDYVRINMRWNLLYDWKCLRRGRIIACAPADFRAEYETARANIGIVHYAGPDDRPWLYPHCDMGAFFWEYARRCPYAGVIRSRLEESHRKPKEVLHRFQSSLALDVGMPAYDIVFPPKSKRRQLTTDFFRSFGVSI